jgi:hypothetical protein
MRLLASANPGLPLGGKHQPATHAVMSERLGYPEIADMKPIPVSKSDQSGNNGVTLPRKDSKLAGGCGASLSLVETDEMPEDEFCLFGGMLI